MSWFKPGGKKPKRSEAPSAAPVSSAADTGHADGGADPFAALAGRPVPAALADLFLTLEEHLNELELEDVRTLVATVRQPLALVDRLTGGLDDPDELRDAILSSPTLSADVLRVVNSAAFPLRNPISSIEHAVTYLGATMVKGLVLQSLVTQIMDFDTDVQKTAYMRIWRGSHIASTTAHAYAKHLGLTSPSVYATRALLVNVGDLALISARPELAVIYAPKSSLLTRVENQQRELMANSAVLSAMLAREWGLPEDLYVALRHSLTPLTWAPDNNERSEDSQCEDILLYLACRVGDAVAYRELEDARDYDVLADESADVFYLPAYLKKLGLESLLDVPRDGKYAQRLAGS